MGIFSTGVYRTVTPGFKGFPDSPLDFEGMAAQQKKNQQIREQVAWNKKVDEEHAVLEKQRYINDIKNRPVLLEMARLNAVNTAYKEVPNFLVAEVFAKIYMAALPHDADFIKENATIFRTIAHRYSDKIGGFDNLRKRAMESQSPLLKGMYDIIAEASKKIIKKKNEQAQSSMSEEEVREMIHPRPTDEEREEILKKIDELGADELAELVNSKVIKVVTDERIRQKTDMEFQTILKSEVEEDPTEKPTASVPMDFSESNATSPEDSTAKKTAESTDTGATDDTATEETEEDKKAAKEAYINAMVKHTMESYDPVTKTLNYHRDNSVRQSLFFHIMESVARDMVLEAIGTPKNTSEAWSKPQAMKLRKDENKSALNVSNLITQDKGDDQIENASKSDPDVLAENMEVPEIDGKTVWHEALTQYTLFETAYTMKLIEITPHDVSEEIERLVNG